MHDNSDFQIEIEDIQAREISDIFRLRSVAAAVTLIGYHP